MRGASTGVVGTVFSASAEPNAPNVNPPTHRAGKTNSIYVLLSSSGRAFSPQGLLGPADALKTVP